MDKVISVVLLLLFLTMVSGAQEKDPMLGFELSEQLRKSASKWNSGDLEGFLQDYLQTEEMTFTSGGQVLQGYEALLERYQQSYGESAESMGKLSFADFKVWRLGSDDALVVGRWELKQNQKGVDKTHEGVFTLVMVKVDDQWKILHDHTSIGKPK